MNRKSNTHANKANSYDLGRPDYPSEFFNYLYDEIGFTKSNTIADIGCGTGKVTRHFLEFGNKVVAIEPDGDMLNIANERLGSYPDYTSFQKTAEATNIKTASIDHIFCGNSYHWFDREKVVPEFQRILRTDGKIVLTELSGGATLYEDELSEIINNFKKPIPNMDRSPPFISGMFSEKVFFYDIFQTFDMFLHGMLSTSFTPSVFDMEYEPFCKAIQDLFNKYKINDKLAGTMRLHCVVGKAEHLNLNMS